MRDNRERMVTGGDDSSQTLVEHDEGRPTSTKASLMGCGGWDARNGAHLIDSPGGSRIASEQPHGVSETR